MQCSGASFCIVLWSNYQLFSKFYDLLLFPPCHRSNESHCELMDLFKNKESFKEKVDSDNNWKTEWFQSDIYFLRLYIIRICIKMFEFCGKPSKFLTKSCLFIFCVFCLIKEELTHQLHLRKYIQNEIFYSTSQKTKE